MGIEDRDIKEAKKKFAGAISGPINWDAEINLDMPSLGSVTQTYLEWIQDGVMPAGVTWYQYNNDNQSFNGWGLLAEQFVTGTGQFASRGGRGAAGPTYVRPDERLVLQAIQGAQNSLVGESDEAAAQALVDGFYADDKANFNNKGQQIDPMAGVLDKIRATESYKQIHSARPSAVDETTWISSRVGKLMTAGISAPLAAELGISQATAATGDETLLAAGQARSFDQSGRMLQSHKQRLRGPVQAAMRLL